MKKEASAAMVLSRNLDFLLDQTGMSVGSLSERSGVSLRRLTDLRQGANARLETIEALANVFKLAPTDLLSPALPIEYKSPGWLSRTSKVYAATSEEGRKLVDSAVAIAEKMAQYK